MRGRGRAAASNSGGVVRNPQRRSAAGQEVPTGGDHRFGSLVDGLDDLGIVDSTQVSGRNREIRVTELALDHDQRDPLPRHLNGVRVAQLMRREPPTDPGRDGGVVQLCADARRRARSAAGRPAHDAEHPSDRQGAAQLKPGFEV
jgi:hypothetical protein